MKQDDLDALEAQGAVHRHLQILVDKPCVSMYLDGRVHPPVGMRSTFFYALGQEMRRVGEDRETALSRARNLYAQLPQDLKAAPGSDGRSFPLEEAEDAIRGAYRTDEIRSYGCRFSLWQKACTGQDSCHFYAQLRRSPTKTGEKPAEVLRGFLDRWLGARDVRGSKLLSEGQLRLYLAVEGIERRRGYPPGATLFVSWSELSEVSGLSDRHVKEWLDGLAGHGLLTWRPGQRWSKGQQRRATEVERVIPVPSPGTPNAERRGKPH